MEKTVLRKLATGWAVLCLCLECVYIIEYHYLGEMYALVAILKTSVSHTAAMTAFVEATAGMIHVISP